MRRRLVAALLGVTLVTIVLFGVPRAFIVAERTQEAEVEDLTRIANTVAGVVGTDLARGQAPDEAEIQSLLGPTDTATIRAADQQVVVGRDGPTEGGLQARVERAEGVSVEISRSRTAVRRQLIDSLTSMALVGLAVLAVAAVVAALLARYLARPFDELARDAEGLGHGHFTLPASASSLPEAVAVREALQASGHRLEHTLRRQREFTSNASHQLRTPLAALRLRLEELTQWPEVGEEVRDELDAAIVQVDRLGTTISGLLELSRAGTYGPIVEVDAAELVNTAAARWQDLARTRGRPLAVDRCDHALVRIAVGAADEVLDALVHNGLEHGVGAITLESVAADGHVGLRVRDEGGGVDPGVQRRLFDRHSRGAGSGGEGIGLALAREVAQSAGGRLLVGNGPPTRFEFVLPHA